MLPTLLRDGIVTSPSHRAPIRLAFPQPAVAILFPDLVFPPTEAELRVPSAPATRVAGAGMAVPDRSAPGRAARNG